MPERHSEIVQKEWFECLDLISKPTQVVTVGEHDLSLASMLTTSKLHYQSKRPTTLASTTTFLTLQVQHHYIPIHTFLKRLEPLFRALNDDFFGSAPGSRPERDGEWDVDFGWGVGGCGVGSAPNPACYAMVTISVRAKLAVPTLEVPRFTDLEVPHYSQQTNDSIPQPETCEQRCSICQMTATSSQPTSTDPTSANARR